MRRGGFLNFYQGFLPCMMPSMDGCRDEWMDGWKASQKMTTTSFTICNCGYLFFFGGKFFIHPSQNVNVSCKMKFIILVESST
jgi:hypothetical protein